LTPNGIFGNVHLFSLSFPELQYRSICMAPTKKDIVDQIQNELGCQRDDSDEHTETLMEIIKSTLKSGDDVVVSGFGKFCGKNEAEPRGRNPATGEDAIWPARRVVPFTCSGKLREKANGS
jgi:integration host factor subunit alpha